MGPRGRSTLKFFQLPRGELSTVHSKAGKMYGSKDVFWIVGSQQLLCGNVLMFLISDASNVSCVCIIITMVMGAKFLIVNDENTMRHPIHGPCEFSLFAAH